MSWVATAIIGSAAIGAAATALDSNEPVMDQGLQNYSDSEALDDRNIKDKLTNTYFYGEPDPHSEQLTNPYQSTQHEGQGYYFDNERGVVMDQGNYLNRTNAGARALRSGTTKHYETGDIVDRFVWTPTEAVSVDGKDSQYNLDRATISAQSELVDPAKNAELAALEYRTLGSEADTSLIGQKTDTISSGLDVTKASNVADLSLLPDKTDATRAGYVTDQARSGEQTRALGFGEKVIPKYMDAALGGVDVNARVTGARATANQNSNIAMGQTYRTILGLGGDPTDPKYASMIEQGELDRAKTVTGAMENAKRGAEEENFKRLSGAYTALGL